MHFLKLLRPLNLLIIGLTMYGAHFFILKWNENQPVQSNGLDFFLLVFSTMIIAAGGNIINDYFDVKADRINKPEKLIITKHIKRRWAILLHWIFNAVGFFIAIYLSAKYDTLWYVLIHLFSINILWFYSMYFKRKVLIGNLLIAVLTALVPILVMIFFKTSNHTITGFSEFHPETWSVTIDFSIIYLLTFFAFTQNFSREIIKDAQDIEGDQLIYVKSLPMVIGVKKSLYVSSLFLMLLPICVILYLTTDLFDFLDGFNKWKVVIPFVISCLFNFTVIFMIFVDQTPKLKRYGILVKLSMLFGIVSTYYLSLLA